MDGRQTAIIANSDNMMLELDVSRELTDVYIQSALSTSVVWLHIASRINSKMLA